MVVIRAIVLLLMIVASCNYGLLAFDFNFMMKLGLSKMFMQAIDICFALAGVWGITLFPKICSCDDGGSCKPPEDNKPPENK